jgi:hypothetical protein
MSDLSLLVFDDVQRVYRVPALHERAHAHPIDGGRYHVQGLNFGMTAPSRRELDVALARLLELDVPHARLSKHGEGYRHEPSGLVIERSLEPWPNGKGNTVLWHSDLYGVRVEWGKVSNARAMLRTLAALPSRADALHRRGGR